MIPREILKKIRQIEIRTNRLVSETLAGQYHSVFKGQGMNFDEVREYQPGDEVRSIDWNDFEPAPVRAAPTSGVIADCTDFCIRRVVLGAGERLHLRAAMT